MENYSVALEQQVALLRWVVSSHSDAYFKKVFGGMEWRDPVRLALEQGETYFWSGQMCDLLNGMVNQNSRIPPFTFSMTDLPSFAGFMWFDNLLVLPPYSAPKEPSGKLDRWLKALAWNPSRYTDGQLTGIAITKFEVLEGIENVLPTNVYQWNEGETQEQVAERETSENRIPLVLAEHNVYREEYRYTKRQYIEIELSYLAACLVLINQRIVTHDTQRAERHARKRLKRQGWETEPVIRVVYLRRRERGASFRMGDEREWSCRWLVRGHWRQQFYPKQNAHKPKWILPHVKGPDDKPLKPPRATVFGVVR